MRVSTAFNRMLRLPGASVQDVAFGSEGMIVMVRLRRRRRVCSGCGAVGLEIKDRRVKRWRHLDLGASRCVIECELRRLRCPGCGDRPEMVPWARAGSSYTRDLEDVVAFLAQQMAKTPLAKLMRISWRSVGNILTRVVADKLDRSRLDGLVMIGVDEVSYASEHRFLTCVADHASGGVVWAAPGRNAATLQRFFDELTDAQRSSIRAVSIDMSAGYEKAIRAAVPDAQVCFDPFHVVALGGRATDRVRREEYNRHGRSGSQHGRWIKGARYSLLKDPANQTDRQLARLADVQRTNKRMYRAFLLLSELRHVYRLPADEAIERLDRWLAWASRSKLKPFVKLARTIRQHKDGVRAAIELGIGECPTLCVGIDPKGDRLCLRLREAGSRRTAGPRWSWSLRLWELGSRRGCPATRPASGSELGLALGIPGAARAPRTRRRCRPVWLMRRWIGPRAAVGSVKLSACPRTGGSVMS